MKKAIIGGLFVIVIILTTTGLVPSCTHDKLNLARFDTVCFKRDILPVFKNGCAIAGCHSGRGEGMVLDSYDGIMRGITPGSAAQSRIYQAITAKLGQPMPPSQALAEQDRIRIRIWIEQGAANTTCDSVPAGYQDLKGGLK
ncbi:MAG: hypothetical protein NTV01_05020 [Bacteroidia bacterium]|nr:hypothetical protein [Bacteroidia bacterium]